MHQLATLCLVGNEPVQRLLACHTALRRWRYAPPAAAHDTAARGMHYVACHSAVGSHSPARHAATHTTAAVFQGCKPTLFLTGVARAPVKALQAEGLRMPTAAAAGMDVCAAAGAPVE